MTLPFTIPPWVPWWVPILVIIPVILYALVLFVMPFSVIGVKSRLDAMDERLDDIQMELHQLAQRLPAPAVGRGFEDTGYTPPPLYESLPEATSAPRMSPTPPVPPAPLTSGRRGETDKGVGRRDGRAEPRLNWPR
jgi:hypothetical protein